MAAQKISKIHDTIDEHIVRTLSYYDIFNYPLKSEEIFRFLGVQGADEATISYRLHFLKEQHIVFQFENFFTLHNNRASIDRRIKGNSAADKCLVIAQKKANFIAKFPFVRAVLGSGSLSKGYMDEHSDLDFFIITAPNRLWIARTLLVMYKKLFLFNSRKYFCINYLVDEDHLEIEEKNLFTATELATVIPLYGSKHYQDLHSANLWLTSFFPNYIPRQIANVPLSKLSSPKRFLEKFLNGIFGNRIERYFHKKTLSRWTNQYQKYYSATDFKVAFKSKSYASKHHPRNYQKKVMEAYAEKLESVGLNSDKGYKVVARDARKEYQLNLNSKA
jgi:hypothetical protein